MAEDDSTTTRKDSAAPRHRVRGSKAEDAARIEELRAHGVPEGLLDGSDPDAELID